MDIEPVTGHCAVAEVRFGSNGDSGGFDAEYRVGDAAGNWSTGRRQWDANLSDGLSSGAVATSFVAHAGGGANGIAWSVTGGVTDPLSFGGVTYGNIVSVKLRAYVGGPGRRMAWSNVVVRFYRNGQLRQSKTIPNILWPDANTLGMGQSNPVVRTLNVTPTATDNDEVSVSASITLEADTGISPSADDIAGQLYLFTDSCA